MFRHLNSFEAVSDKAVACNPKLSPKNFVNIIQCDPFSIVNISRGVVLRVRVVCDQ